MTPPRLRWVEFATSRLLSPGGLLVSQVGIDQRGFNAHRLTANRHQSGRGWVVGKDLTARQRH